jgi:hypothetical protein
MDTRKRMAKAAWPCGEWWTNYLASIYDSHAWEVSDFSIVEAAKYLATRAYYYVDSARDTFMIGDEPAMRQLLTEDRNAKQMAKGGRL